MTNSYDVDHGLSQDEPGPLEPVEIAQQPGAAPATGNTARDQEMYAAGIRTGEENAKHNAAIRAGVPDGWKLVPIEPTIDMLADADETGNVLGPRARRIYAAMLNAAPAAPGVSTVEAHREYGSPARILRQFLTVDGFIAECDIPEICARLRPAPAAGDAQDAARYRWLCDKFGITKLPCAIERIIEGSYVPDGKEGIDAAIDAAIAAQRKGDA